LSVHTENCTAPTTNQEEALEGVLPENTRFAKLPTGQRSPETDGLAGRTSTLIHTERNGRTPDITPLLGNRRDFALTVNRHLI
jgi:hypothetical protein